MQLLLNCKTNQFEVSFIYSRNHPQFLIQHFVVLAIKLISCESSEANMQLQFRLVKMKLNLGTENPG